MKKVILMSLVLFFTFGVYAQTPVVTVPNTFVSGGTISAAEMNANFAALKQAIMDEVVPIGTVISSLVPPDASKDYMSGTSGQVWAYADGSKPTSAPTYSGSFPDLRGKFLRGLDDGLAYTGGVSDPDTARLVGSLQADSFQGHRHRLSNYVVTMSGADDQIDFHSLNASIYDANYHNDPGPVGQFVLDPYADGTNGTPRVSLETRPTNVAVYWYIKVK